MFGLGEDFFWSHLFIFFHPKTQGEQRLAPLRVDGQVRTQDCLKLGQQAAEAHLPNVSAGAASVSPPAPAQERWWEHRCGAPAGSCLRGPGCEAGALGPRGHGWGGQPGASEARDPEPGGEACSVHLQASRLPLPVALHKPGKASLGHNG